jgi:hypothetical protein
VINEGLSEIIGPFPVPSLRDKRERNDDPGQKRRGRRYSAHPSNHVISIDYRDRRSVNDLDRSQPVLSRDAGSKKKLRGAAAWRGVVVPLQGGNADETDVGRRGRPDPSGLRAEFAGSGSQIKAELGRILTGRWTEGVRRMALDLQPSITRSDGARAGEMFARRAPEILVCRLHVTFPEETDDVCPPISSSTYGRSQIHFDRERTRPRLPPPQPDADPDAGAASG